MNNELNKEINYVSPFKKFCITIGNLPTAYLESMSYYEGLTYLVNYLSNNVIPALNNNGEAVEELQQKYIEFTGGVDTAIEDFEEYVNGKVDELEEFMNNYFDNLDVQQEINNKLDLMASNGDLAAAVLPYMSEFYVPRTIQTKITDSISDGGFVEKSNGINDITYSTNNYTIRDSTSDGIINLSNATHGIVDNLHLSNENAGILISKDSGWNGSNRFSNLYTYGCKYPFKISCNDVTDTYLSNCTFENWRKAIEVNNKLKIENIYVGDNDLTLDANELDTAIVANSNANIDIHDSTISCSVRNDGRNYPVIKFNATSDNPAIVSLENCRIASPNQNVTGRGYGGIADLSNANDRLYIDNCTFTKSSLNDNHNVAPYILKPYQTVWSKNPFYSYTIGGDLYDINRLAPTASTISLASTSNKNPFGGNIIEYAKYGFDMYYKVPKNLVNKQMYLHIYTCKLENAISPCVSYSSSDCVESGTAINFKEGKHGQDTPYLNVIPFTPNKEIGKIKVYVNDGSGGTAHVQLAGIFLVEEQFRYSLCCYREYTDKSYSGAIPTYTGTNGEIVYSTDPANTNCDGWKYTTQWNAFTF